MASHDTYGELGSVPTTENSGVSGAGISANASPAAFGANVGQTISGAGEQAEQLSNHFAQIATEAKVNDDYANKYIPAAAKLRENFDSLRGQDKIAGYDGYVSGLQDLNKQFTSMQSGSYGQKLMSSQINRHVEGEIFGAKRELVASQNEFADQSRWDIIKANNDMAAQNYDNAPLVKSYQEQNDNHILVHSIDQGVNPNDDAGKSFISDAQKSTTGQMAGGMIRQAVNKGDMVSANALRANYADSMPGYQKLTLDNTLHAENIRQGSIQTITSIKTGQPIPEAIGAPPSQVQAVVADTAKSSGIDPNHALAVLRIESSNGQNLGSRGTIGQDKESQGKPLGDQAKALCDNLKTAETQATSALGRQAQPWEGYVTYQQGAGGGPALLKAAEDNPNMSAVEVLSKFYNNPKDALSAVNANGGNSTMSASDFVDHIKQTYQDSVQKSNCDFGDYTTPGDAIMAPHQTPGVTVQPAASPIQSQLNFEKKVPAYMDQINSIPNNEVRAGVMKQFNQERTRYQDAATAYKNVLVNQAGQLAADPKFTSMEQVPPEVHAALATDHPQTLTYLENRAEYNKNHTSGNNTKDMREYGNGFYDLFKAIHTTQDDPSKINSISELQSHIGKDGDLTIAGYDRLSKELQGKSTPEGEAESIMKKQFLETAKQQISGKDDNYGIKDPKGEEMYLKFLANVLPAYDQGRSDGKSAAELLNPESSSYVGKSIGSFKRTQAQMLADMERESPSITPEEEPSTLRKLFSVGLKDELRPGYINTPEGLKQAVINGKMTRQEAEAEAIKRGYIRQGSKISAPLAE